MHGVGVNVKTRLDENEIQASRVASSDENGNRHRRGKGVNDHGIRDRGRLKCGG